MTKIVKSFQAFVHHPHPMFWNTWEFGFWQWHPLVLWSLVHACSPCFFCCQEPLNKQPLPPLFEPTQCKGFDNGKPTNNNKKLATYKFSMMVTVPTKKVKLTHVQALKFFATKELLTMLITNIKLRTCKFLTMAITTKKNNGWKFQKFKQWSFYFLQEWQQIWVQPKCHNKFLTISFYVFGYLLEPCI